MLINFF
jgi:hypothetical protein